MKPKFRKALAALLAVVCAVCLGRTALQLVQYRQGDETYAQAEELAGLPDLSDLPAGAGAFQAPPAPTGRGRPRRRSPCGRTPTPRR